jgi:hypothetical protein
MPYPTHYHQCANTQVHEPATAIVHHQFMSIALCVDAGATGRHLQGIRKIHLEGNEEVMRDAGMRIADSLADSCCKERGVRG